MINFLPIPERPHPIIVYAKDRKQAWNKFCEQFFGPLKPSKAEWSIKEVDTDYSAAKALGLKKYRFETNELWGK